MRYKKLGEGDHITQTYNLNWNKKWTNLEQEMNVSLTWLKSDLSTQLDQEINLLSKESWYVLFS
jgi:hypothetical protein